MILPTVSSHSNWDQDQMLKSEIALLDDLTFDYRNSSSQIDNGNPIARTWKQVNETNTLINQQWTKYLAHRIQQPIRKLRIRIFTIF